MKGGAEAAAAVAADKAPAADEYDAKVDEVDDDEKGPTPKILAATEAVAE